MRAKFVGKKPTVRGGRGPQAWGEGVTRKNLEKKPVDTQVWNEKGRRGRDREGGPDGRQDRNLGLGARGTFHLRTPSSWFWGSLAKSPKTSSQGGAATLEKIATKTAGRKERDAAQRRKAGKKINRRMKRSDNLHNKKKKTGKTLYQRKSGQKKTGHSRKQNNKLRSRKTRSCRKKKGNFH